MNTYEWIGLIIAALAGGFAALSKTYRFGPSPDKPTNAPVPEEIPEIEDIPPQPVEAPHEAPVASGATLENLCLAIRDFEGVQVNKQGKPDKNWRNNNPGNCRYSPVGYLPKYLPVLKDKDGFAIFKDYATGWDYLRNMLKAQIHLHPNWTILDLMTNYAPESDNNPTLNYAKHVAKRLGVGITFQVKDIAV